MGIRIGWKGLSEYPSELFCCLNGLCVGHSSRYPLLRDRKYKRKVHVESFMAFCRDCGGEIDSSAKFCPNCASPQDSKTEIKSPEKSTTNRKPKSSEMKEDKDPCKSCGSTNYNLIRKCVSSAPGSPGCGKLGCDFCFKQASKASVEFMCPKCHSNLSFRIAALVIIGSIVFYIYLTNLPTF